jgi:enterochelin esterase-like enzyme
MLVILLAGCGTPAPVESIPEPPANPTPSATLTAGLSVTPHPTASTTPEPPFTGTPEPLNTPTATASIRLPACIQAGGEVVLEHLRSDLLRLPMEVRVYLPPCYKEQSGQRYPVLYLLHGQNFTEEQWIDLGVVETTNRLIAAGEVPPFLIVMPRDRLWQDPPQTSFDEVFINQLMPWVDGNFDTQAERAYRAVGGLSRGGAWALHFGLRYHELFGKVGIHSGFIFWSDTPFIRRLLDEGQAGELPRLYLDIGHRDYLLEANQYLVELLDDYDVPHEYYQFIGYHDDEYWRANVERYLQWYGKDW